MKNSLVGETTVAAATVDTEKPQHQVWHVLLSVQLLLFTFLGLYCTWCQRYLYADGSWFVLLLLKSQSISDFFPARYFAHIITQLPAVILIRGFDCRSIGVIAATYGATQYLTPVLGLLVCSWAGRKAPPLYLAFPMLSQSLLFLTTSFVMFCEIQPAVWLFWCLLYLFLYSDRLTFSRSIVAIACALLATRVYESYVFLAWPLLIAAWRRAVIAWRLGNKFEVSVCIVCMLGFLSAFLIALASILVPFDEGNRQHFAASLIEHLEYPPAQFAIFVVAAIFVQIHLEQQLVRWIICFLLTCLGLVVVASPLLGNPSAWSLQYNSRVQAFYLPLIFGTAILWNSRALRDCSRRWNERQGCIWFLVALSCLTSFCFQTCATYRWNNYRLGLLTTLKEHPGVIDYGATDRSKEFDWGWAMPSLSVAVGALDSHQIIGIIAADDEDAWQPFDPRQTETIPDLDAYSVSNQLSQPRDHH